MPKTRVFLSILLLFCSVPLFAQASRTWVSGVGDDANPCSRTAPCKTFAGAISKTAAGGVIDALDPAGYGAVTITKAITIDGGGELASVLVSGTNGIVVQAGPSDVVTLRNIEFVGLGTGINGIRFLAGAALHVEGCRIYEFTNNGIDTAMGSSGRLFVRDTFIHDNGGIGISVQTTAGTVRGSIDNVRLDRNGVGMRIQDNTKFSVRHSVADANGTNGFLAISTVGGVSQLTLDDCVSTNNGTNGAKADGASATVFITNFTASANDNTGVSVANGGSISSYGNNHLAGNAAGTGTVSTVLANQ